MKKSAIKYNDIDQRFKVFRLDISQVTLILVNLIPLFGVLFFGWSTSSIIYLYYVETIIIGFIYIFKLKAYYNYKKIQGDYREYIIGLIFLILLFSIFITIISAVSWGIENKSLTIIGEGNTFYTPNLNVFGMLKEIYISILISSIFFLISHIISFKTNFLDKKRISIMEY